MAENLSDLFVRFFADTAGFKGPVDAAGKQLEGFEKTAEKLTSRLSSMGNDFAKLGVSLSAAITAPLVGLGATSTREFEKFELSMRQVTSLMGKVSEGEFKQLSDQTLELAKHLGVDAVQAAQGLYEAISAGVPKENALTFMEVASKTAIAGVTETKVAVDALTTVLNAYKLKATEVQGVADAMFQAVNIGKFSFAELAGSMSKAMPIASAVGVSFKEVLAAAATLSKQGTDVNTAMTEIGYAINSLLNPSKQMRVIFGELGVSSGRLLLESRGLEGALNAVRDAAHGNDQALIKAVRSVEGFRAVLGLTGQNAKGAAEDLKAITESGNAMTLAFDEINKSGARGLEGFKSAVQNLGIQLGEVLAPSLAKIVAGAQPLIDFAISAVHWFAQLDPGVQSLALGFVAMAAAMGPITLAIGGILKGFSAVAGVAGSLSQVLGVGGLLGTATALSPAIIAIGAALAGIAVVGAVTKLQGLNSELNKTFESFEKWKELERKPWLADWGHQFDDVNEKLRQARLHGESFESAARKLGGTLKASAADGLDFGIKVSIAGNNAADSTSKVDGLGAAHTRTSVATKGHTAAVKDSVTVLDKSILAFGTVSKEVTVLSGYVTVLTETWEQHNAELMKSIDGLLTVGGAFRGLTAEEINAKSAALDLSAAYEDVTGTATIATKNTKKLGDQWAITGQKGSSAALQIHNVLANDLTRSLSDVATGTLGLGEAFKRVGKDIVSIVVDNIIGQGLKPMLAEIDKVLLKLPGLSGIPGFGGGGTSAPPVNLPSDLPPGGGSGSSGGSAASAAAGWAGVAVQALDAIFQNVALRRIESDIAKIEVTSRGQLNEALNLRADEWTREGHLFAKLDDIWNEIRNVGTVLTTMGSFMFPQNTSVRDASGNVALEGTDTTDFYEVLAKQIIPASSAFGESISIAGDSASEFTVAATSTTKSLVNLSDSINRSVSAVAPAFESLVSDFSASREEFNRNLEAIYGDQAAQADRANATLKDLQDRIAQGFDSSLTMWTFTATKLKLFDQLRTGEINQDQFNSSLKNLGDIYFANKLAGTNPNIRAYSEPYNASASINGFTSRNSTTQQATVNIYVDSSSMGVGGAVMERLRNMNMKV